MNMAERERIKAGSVCRIQFHLCGNSGESRNPKEVNWESYLNCLFGLFICKGTVIKVSNAVLV